MGESRRWVDASRGASTVGVDVEDVERWQQPDERLFTATERAHCLAQGDPAQAFAGRWAAKEAVVKAVLAYCAVSPRDVEIVAAEDGAPGVRLRLPEGMTAAPCVSVSISHTRHTAVASAVATFDRAALQGANPGEVEEHS